MKKLILISLLSAPISLFADTYKVYANVTFGESAPTGTACMVNFYRDGNHAKLLNVIPGTTTNLLVYAIWTSGPWINNWKFSIDQTALEVVGNVTELSYADNGTFAYTHDFWVGCVEAVSFPSGQLDSVPRIYYSDGATRATTLTNFSIGISTTNSPTHVEVWPNRALLGSARINENSRNITWHYILYDADREPYRDNTGRVVVFAISPEWRRQSELYTGGE